MFSKLSRREQISEEIPPSRPKLQRSDKTFLNKKYRPFVLVINGSPGTGKLTVGKELHLALTNSILLDNHTLIDTVEVITNRGASNYVKGRKLFLDAAVQTLIEEPDETKQFLFTSVLTTQKGTTLEQYLKLAQKRGVPFICVNLDISEEENRARVSSRERKSSGTGKATNPNFISDWRRSRVLLDPSSVAAFRRYKGKFKQLDVTGKSSEETARDILKLVDTL